MVLGAEFVAHVANNCAESSGAFVDVEHIWKSLIAVLGKDVRSLLLLFTKVRIFGGFLIFVLDALAFRKEGKVVENSRNFGARGIFTRFVDTLFCPPSIFRCLASLPALLPRRARAATGRNEKHRRCPSPRF